MLAILVPYFTNGTGNNLTASILSALAQSILGSPATGLAKGYTTPISSLLNANTDFLNKTAPNANNGSGNLPKAYLTIVFFNERFEFVSEGSTSLRVTQPGNNASPLVIPNVKAPKNGYAYVYLSNENAEPVYGACPDKRSGSGMILKLLIRGAE